MKKIIFIILICASGSLFAQSNTTISYTIGFGMGDMSDYISKPSFRGINFDYRHYVNTNIALGVNVAWSTFYEDFPKQTYTIDNESLTGKQYRYVNSVPMAATVGYFMHPDEQINPFFSLGIGTVYTLRNTNMNLYTWEQEAWNFLLQPEVGIQYQLTEGTAATISLKYNHGFEAGDELPNAQSYLALNIGFSFF